MKDSNAYTSMANTITDNSGNKLQVEWYETCEPNVTCCGIELLDSKYECPAGSSLDWALAHDGIQCDDVANLSDPIGIIPIDKETLNIIEAWRDKLDNQLTEFYDVTTTSYSTT